MSQPKAPIREEQTSSSEATQDRGSGFMAELERDKAHRKKARSVKPLRQLLPFIMKYPGLLVAFVFFLVLASSLTLLLPAAFRLVIDCGFGEAGNTAICTRFSVDDQISGFFVTGILLAMLLGVASALRFYFISRLGERVVADLRQKVYGHILILSPAFYAQVRTGEVLSRLTTDTTLIQTVVGSSFSIAIRTIATSFGAIFLMFVLSWKLTLMVLGVGPILVLPIIYFGRRVQRLSRSAQDNLANASARASEALRAVETVQAFNREKMESALFGEAVEETFDAALKRIRVRSYMSALITSLIFAGLIGVLWIATSQVHEGSLSPGAMTQFIFYAFIAVSGLGMLSETYTEIMRAAGATERLMELLSARSQINSPAKPLTFQKKIDPAKSNISSEPTQNREIRFENVDFSYPSRADSPVLRDVSLTVKAGQTIALVGPSGAGKSTMFQLLLRFYDPQKGRILIDGIDIRDLSLEELRQSLSIVQQNAPLFGGTPADNIRFGFPAAQKAQIIDAAQAANAHGFIEKLPQGYDTSLGEEANDLSGGQQQRIAIARAMLRDAPILLLDEATSALDSESERAIQDAFEKISKNRTTLVIAHRLSTVLKADRIIVFEEGRVVDQGTHDELMARGGLYAHFAKLQFDQTFQAAE